MRLSCLRLVLLLAVCQPAALFAHGSVHERLAAVERKLVDSPQDPALLLQRAKLHEEHGDHDKALEDLATIGRVSPAFVDRWLLEATIHLALEKPEAALAAIDRLMEQQPKSVEGRSLRSRILEILGRHPEAIKDARMVIGMAPEASLQHHLRLIQLLERHGKQADVGVAFSDARRSVGRFPVLLQQEARWLAKVGDREQASKVHAELRETVPGMAFSSHVEEARLWLDHDDDRARLSINQADRAWSELPPAVRTRGAMLAKHRELQGLRD